MPTRCIEAMQALSRFDELAWFKLTADYNCAYGYHQVPYLGWRYTFPREGIAQYIEDAVRGVPTQVQWELDRRRANWILLPSRILHEAEGLDNPAFADTVHSINVYDQEFCLKALSDLERIIARLQQLPIPET